MMSEDQKRLSQAFMQLSQPKDKVQCQYVWIDGSLRNLRTKSKTWPKEPIIGELPVMEFCGSATDFDVGNLADYYSHPVKVYRDPFRGGNNRLIYCETRTRESLPTFANNRHRLRMVMEEKFQNQVTEFSFYQPYTLLRKDGKPLSYMDPAYSPDSTSGFNCGREIAESHYRACLYAGVDISSLEAVSNQGQWRYSVGPSSSVKLGDDVWMSRFLLIRVAEDFGVTASFDSSYEWKCLKPLSVVVDFTTDHLIQQYRQRIIDDLFSKFSIKEKPMSIVTPPNKIVLKGINSDIDPYSILARVLETASC